MKETELKKYVEGLASDRTLDHFGYLGFIDGYMHALCDNEACDQFLMAFIEWWDNNPTGAGDAEEVVKRFKESLKK